MGSDIAAFVEIESSWAGPGRFESLFKPAGLGRNYAVFEAFGHPRNEMGIQPLYPLRGLPPNLGSQAFYACYLPILEHHQILDWRGQDFVLNYEVGNSTVIKDPEGKGKPMANLGYVVHGHFEMASWLMLSEMVAAIEHFGLRFGEHDKEYAFLFEAMANAERVFQRKTRLVFGFDQ